MPNNKPKPFHKPERDKFIETRIAARLQQKDVAALLHVTLTTVKNWESGKTEIPYSAFKLLRILGRHELPGERWDGWVISQGALWSPAGRRFESYDLIYIQNMFAMARFWLAERKAMQEQRKRLHEAQQPVFRLIQGGKG